MGIREGGECEEVKNNIQDAVDRVGVLVEVLGEQGRKGVGANHFVVVEEVGGAVEAGVVVEDYGGGGDGIGVEAGVVFRERRETGRVVWVVAALVVGVAVFAFVAVAELEFFGFWVGGKRKVG